MRRIRKAIKSKYAVGQLLINTFLLLPPVWSTGAFNFGFLNLPKVKSFPIPTTGRKSSGFFVCSLSNYDVFSDSLCKTHILEHASLSITTFDPELIPCQQLFFTIQPDVFRPVMVCKLQIVFVET